MMTIDKIEILNFIKSKNFRSIKMNASKMDILKIFGEPNILEPQKKSYPEIHSYGILEIRYLNDKVQGFSFDYQKKEIFASSVLLEKTFQVELEEFMRKNDIFFEKDNILSGDNNELLITCDGINLGFINSELVIFGF